MALIRIPAVYMRGGTSKGVFFHTHALPADPARRDRLLLRVIGSPDPYGKQIDGMGAATSSTSKVVLISKSQRPDSDVDYLFGQVAIDAPLIDWSGNCGNLTAAVGPFAIREGLVPAGNGTAVVRIWQVNIRKRIIAHVPVRDGEVDEEGAFMLDGVAFPAAPIKIEFLDPGGMEGETAGGAMFPTGHVVDALDVPNIGHLQATLINAGNPTVFVEARTLQLKGTELQEDVNGNAEVLGRIEAIRSHAAVAMGLASSPEDATCNRPHTPKVAYVAPPRSYTASSGARVSGESMDLLARIVSMGKLHHAMTGTGAVALAVAAAIPGTIVQRTIGTPHVAGETCFGHPSGLLKVGAEAAEHAGTWTVGKVIMHRSARRLMDGWVSVPESAIS